MTTYFPAVFGDNLFDIFDVFDRNMFNGFGSNADRALYGKHVRNLMKTDVRETNDGYTADIELPGFNKDEIRLELENGYLTVSTEKVLEKKDEQEGRLLRQERYTGTMQRSFYVGKDITEDDVKASFENGVLHLNLPKKETPRMPERKTIMIEG